MPFGFFYDKEGLAGFKRRRGRRVSGKNEAFVENSRRKNFTKVDSPGPIGKKQDYKS